MNFLTQYSEVINDTVYDILIGKNAIGNEHIIKISHPNSIWMHLNNISSPHLILQSNGDTIPKRHLNQIAKMLFTYKHNVPKNCNVIYTLVKNVKLTKTPGTVIPKNVKLIKF